MRNLNPQPYEAIVEYGCAKLGKKSETFCIAKENKPIYLQIFLFFLLFLKKKFYFCKEIYRL